MSRKIVKYPYLPDYCERNDNNGEKYENVKEGFILVIDAGYQTHNVITRNRVGSAELMTMVTVTKNHIHSPINWKSVNKGFYFKFIYEKESLVH